jgi:hypothetical protein
MKENASSIITRHHNLLDIETLKLERFQNTVKNPTIINTPTPSGLVKYANAELRPVPTK